MDEWEKRRVGSKMTTLTLENLSCGTPYLFKIAAENVIGLGQFSQVLKARTNGNKPEGAKLTDVLEGNTTVIQIDLTRWPDGGCPIKNFQIEYKALGKQGQQQVQELSGSSTWQRIYRRDNQTRVFVFNTIPNMNYDVSFSVMNEAGSIEKVFRIEANPGKLM